MYPILKLKPIRGRQSHRLRELYAHSRQPRVRRRGQIILLAHDGYGTSEIAKIARQSPMTIRRTFHRFMERGCAGLVGELRPGRPAPVTAAMDAYLRAAVVQSPHDFGLARPGWTTQLLARLVRRQFHRTVSDECIRQHLARIGGVCRRPTWTVKHIAQV
jgi:transposase